MRHLSAHYERGKTKMPQLKLENLGIVTEKDAKGKLKYKGKSINPSITAEELGEPGAETEAIIKGAETVIFDGKEDAPKVMLSVLIPSLEQSEEGSLRRLGLNKTNLLTMLTLFGENTDNWVNKEIGLRVDSVNFKGDMVSAIRIQKS